MSNPKFRYSASIQWSEEDDAFIAEVPELPGCTSHGETPQEAAAELQKAIEAWIEAALAAGNSIPAANVRLAVI